eukprot:scaffold3234_cov166-Amphora_coffeaeformis.AAC.3
MVGGSPPSPCAAIFARFRDKFPPSPVRTRAGGWLPPLVPPVGRLTACKVPDGSVTQAVSSSIMVNRAP